MSGYTLAGAPGSGDGSKPCCSSAAAVFGLLAGYKAKCSA
jgi:hypothetical protein